MDRINLYQFYDLGKRLNIFEKRGTGDIHPRDVAFDIWYASDAVTQLIEGKLVPLGVSRAAAVDLNTVVNQILEDHFYSKDEKGNKAAKLPDSSDAPISGWLVGWYRRSLESFETIFSAEMREASTYHVPRRGNYYTPSLVNSADDSFLPVLSPFIPNKTREEWCSAGRCLAFGLWSASGFHVARAVEGILEPYYQFYCGAPGATKKTWGDYIAALKAVIGQPVPSTKTITELEQMKDDYRNPLMHPRVSLTEPDARILFNNGESLIIGMADEMRAEQQKVQPSLGLLAQMPAP